MKPNYEPTNGRCTFDFDFILQSKLGVTGQERSVSMRRSIVKAREFYTATINGIWVDPKAQWPEAGEYLSQAECTGSIFFTTAPDEHTYLSFEKSVDEIEEEDDPEETYLLILRKAHACIKIDPGFMSFLINTVRQAAQINITVTVCTSMEINKRMKEFLSGDQDMDFQYEITEFYITS